MNYVLVVVDQALKRAVEQRGGIWWGIYECGAGPKTRVVLIATPPQELVRYWAKFIPN